MKRAILSALLIFLTGLQLSKAEQTPAVHITKSHWSWFGLWDYERIVQVTSILADGTTTINLACLGSGDSKCEAYSVAPTYPGDPSLNQAQSGFINLTIMLDLETVSQNGQLNGSKGYTQEATIDGASVTYIYNVNWQTDNTGAVTIDISIS